MYRYETAINSGLSAGSRVIRSAGWFPQPLASPAREVVELEAV